MMNFKVGDKVFGVTKDAKRGNFNYTGVITLDFEDGSYEVDTGNEILLVELYYHETMEHATKSHEIREEHDTE